MNWAEKYRPQTLDDLYLNSDTKTNIKNWINDFKSKKKDFTNCLILHGPPGIGKTSIANLLLKTNDFDVIEFNSSDIRNQKTLKDKIEEINGNINILDFMCNKKKPIGIIIDELDGINSTEKGAIKELTSIINNTKEYSSPFICTTNSINKRIDMLKKKSLYIKLNKPSLNTIKQFINKICINENLDLSYEIKHHIAKTSQLDFRRVIVLMEYLFNYNINNLSEEEIIKTIETYDKKSLDYTCYEATDKILNNYYNDFSEIINYDKSNIGYLLYENFQSFIINNKKCSDDEKMNIISKIYNEFCISDILDKKIYINQQFYLSNYNDFVKFNIPSYLINSLDKTSYNKFNKLNYSTMINKISFEYLNVKLINSINELGISNNHIYTADYIYSNIKSLNESLISLINTHELDKTFIEKICKLSSLYNKDKDKEKEFKKQITKYYKLFK
jgi:DNA polymerase III delta prime subunit